MLGIWNIEFTAFGVTVVNRLNDVIWLSELVSVTIWIVAVSNSELLPFPIAHELSR